MKRLVRGQNARPEALGQHFENSSSLVDSCRYIHFCQFGKVMLVGLFAQGSSAAMGADSEKTILSKSAPYWTFIVSFPSIIDFSFASRRS